MFRKLILAAVLAGSFAAIATPAAAQRRTAPPEARTEATPEERRGYQWVAGHYEWRDSRYRWIAGHYVRERRGHRYNQAVWVERDGRWYLQRGSWQRRGDRDGDGVPNRDDRRPNNPNRS
jgi:hypothetical protein